MRCPQSDGARFPFFSPDGEWVGFWTGGTLYRVPSTGGQPLPIGNAPELEFGAAWGSDETIVFSTGREMYRVPAAGGQAERLVADGESVSGNYPQFLPDGSLLAVSDGRIVRFDMDTLAAQTLWEPAEPIKQARYLKSGHLVYGSAGDIIALALDLEGLEAGGAAVPVAQDLFEGARGSGAVYFASSSEGTMVSVRGGVQHSLVLVDRTGRSRILAPERGPFRHPSFSPNGQRVAVAIDDDPRSTHIWLYDLRGRRERFTAEYHNITSVFTPDGDAIAFCSYGRGIAGGGPYLKSLRGTNGVEPLLTAELATPYNQFPGSYSPDGNLLVFTEQHPVTGNDLWLLDLAGEPPTSRELVVTPFSESDPRVSPDGRWLAYTSNRSGRAQVHVRPFGVDGADRTVSVDGGREPRWSGASGELFFRNGDLMLVADIQAGSDLIVSEPRVLFEGSYNAGDMVNYDVTHDGQTFVMIETDPRGDGRRLEIVQNWFDELQRLVPIP